MRNSRQKSYNKQPGIRAMYFRLAIWFIFIFGGIAGGYYLDSLWFPSAHAHLLWHALSLAAGILLLRVVLRVSRNTGRALAKQGRKGDIPRMQTNVLARDGIYACMRHPMHLGLMFFPISIALIAGSPSFIMLIAPVEMLLMLVMIFSIEEKEALRKFGDDYRRYRREVPAFSFRWSCLKKLYYGEIDVKA